MTGIAAALSLLFLYIGNMNDEDGKEVSVCVPFSYIHSHFSMSLSVHWPHRIWRSNCWVSGLSVSNSKY